MEVIGPAPEVRAWCDDARARGARVGFVPTMGAFHDGHVALMRRARDENDAVVVSLFVNPLQFGDPADLAAYPRDAERDRTIADGAGVDLLWSPTVAQMYPAGDPVVTVDPGVLGERFEGASRPGHFRGVATVVARLFNGVGACRAYFGEKDAQQLAVVRRMVADLGQPVEVIAHPTVRETDGLAMSSRNVRLTPEQRAAAPCLFLGLTEAATLVRAGTRSAAELVAAIAREVGGTEGVDLEYAAVVDERTFAPVEVVEGPARAIVAARFGAVRLIDTLGLPG